VRKWLEFQVETFGELLRSNFCSALAWLTNGRRFGAGVNLVKVLVSLPALSGALAGPSGSI
jgi:hypothetical protein